MQPTSSLLRLVLSSAVLAASVASAAGAQRTRAEQAATRSAARASADSAARARIDSLARRFLVDAPAAGLTLAVLRGSDTLVLRGYGEADRASRRAAGRETVYRIGSVTKQFTAATVLQLVEQGRLSLDDSLGAHLPRYARWSGVTIRQLLNHTSGIPVFNTSPAWVSRRAEPMPVDTALGLISGGALRFTPGTRFEYNNSGYLLLTRIVEQSTGVPFGEYLRERVFEPLGMRSAGYCADVATQPAEARGYELTPGGIAPAEAIHVAVFAGSGALCMNVPDYLRWQTALTDGRVVTRATFARMSRSDTVTSGARTGYGLGLMPRASVGRAVIAHGGDINGFSAEQLWMPEDSLRVVVFTNTISSAPTLLADNLSRAARGLPARPNPMAVSAELRATVPGTYALAGPGGMTLSFAVWSAGERLMGQVQAPGSGQQAFPLVALPDGSFGAGGAAPGTFRLRITVENGRGVRAELRQHGMTFAGERIP